MILDDFLKDIRKLLSDSFVPTQHIPNPATRISTGIIFTNGKEKYRIPVYKEERCVLIVDIVGFSKKDMVEQLLLVETMNILFKKSVKRIKRLTKDWKKWDVYKGTGDGAIFVFGQELNPISVRDAFQFAAWTMTTIIEHNKRLPPNALNCLEVRMALSYGEIYVTEDLEGKKDALGEAINLAARLASVKEAKANSIFISSEIYHNLQINKDAYFVNQDGSIPTSGDFGDFIIGKSPDAHDFLYIVRKGHFETKDRFVEAFNVSGRLDGTNIKET